MKRLKCELCGSSDIIKKDDFYVCESCGTKYTVEEAKKLLVDVSGSTVNVANNPQEKNLEKLASDAYLSKNWKSAEDFANQTLAINDKNFEAWEVKALAVCMQLSPFESRMLESMNCLSNAFLCKNGDEQKEYSSHLVKHFENIVGSEINARTRNFAKSGNGVELLNKTLRLFNTEGKRILVSIGLSEDQADTEFNSMANKMISEGFDAMKSAWELAARKYYKNDFSNLGSKWTRNKVDMGGDVCFDENDRPDKIDFDFYLSAIDEVISLGQSLIEIVNPETDGQIILSILKEMIRIDELALSVVSFETYWPVFGSTKRWMIEYELSESSKNGRKQMINEWKTNVSQVENMLKN